MVHAVVHDGDGREVTAGDAPLVVDNDETHTRTRSGSGDDAVAGAPGRPEAERRLPAPLQYRDPDRYEIVAEHGRGGLGRVFRARDKELGRDVALKELLTRGSTTELRFFREALITARLEHPGIVPIHEAGRWPDGTPFYAMKLVAGRPLKALIEDCKTLEDRLALLPNIIAVADAIAYAHDRKIIHRDLKPSNVIVGDFGETVVIDWGLAKDISAQDDLPDPIEDGPFRTAAPPDGLTVAGSILGTPAYMSPEQARGEPVDERADVYALGAIVSELASPRLTPAPAIPSELQSIIRKARAKIPGDRHSSARAFAEDLRAFVQGRHVLAHSYTRPELAFRWLQRRRTIAITVTIAVLVLLIVTTTASVQLARRNKLVQNERNSALVARRDSDLRADDLTLAQATLLLDSDPAKTLEMLRAYEGRTYRASEVAALVADAESRGVTIATFAGHNGRITAIASDDSGTVASTSTDGSLRVWTLSQSHELQTTSQVVADGVPELVDLVVRDGRAFAIATSGNRTAFLFHPRTG